MSRLIYTYAYAKVAFDDAIALLAGDPERLLQDATDVSAADADSVVANLHVSIAGHDIDRDVTIELGEFDPVEVLRSVVPVRWRATRGHLWFPTMDATLEITALSLRPPLVQVTLAGSYEPPLGTLGAVLDAVAAHRIAEATAHTFVNEVARRLEELVARTEDPVRAGPIPVV